MTERSPPDRLKLVAAAAGMALAHDDPEYAGDPLGAHEPPPTAREKSLAWTFIEGFVEGVGLGFGFCVALAFYLAAVLA